MRTGVLCGLFQVILLGETSCFLNKIVDNIVCLPLSSDMKTFFRAEMGLSSSASISLWVEIGLQIFVSFLFLST